uniref:Uncharacterized protein n=1 Tax=Calcidiscus leptoporus TaxID=127549 RepID=A0A7S0J382_9EUKA|mmetsp:Transcript_36448/g.85151  ORF Transcript_36448/g.85151 Transcript_36448/m.85151 type:complete len:164 (+) Transcript_36448:115-606(+)|eukprot:CAMPEP_0119359408 /NCGR_PEP_ID=MMETSP1334-20130426/7303_1 /TAXON_ID=127549 /ORGANISM="Calcidiscus leptoporus, Strain RCC1130" /LENGTH=163 /DNA_ID=CAMNT_0007374075 /DNA_START=107 /DNA_END=598 /DNA_ORIENTATION=+
MSGLRKADVAVEDVENIDRQQQRPRDISFCTDDESLVSTLSGIPECLIGDCHSSWSPAHAGDLRVRIDGWARCGSHDEYKVIAEHVWNAAATECVWVVGAALQRFSEFRQLHAEVGALFGVRFKSSRKLRSGADWVRAARATSLSLYLNDLLGKNGIEPQTKS